ncbi:MAG: hypothetical protein JSV96_16860 [Candidatus Aminicenantes bacterium]|nr:MAG: hypothetical protein JSV96_16860 [Candidatus Aminicenantes bacterium]
MKASPFSQQLKKKTGKLLRQPARKRGQATFFANWRDCAACCERSVAIFFIPRNDRKVGLMNQAPTGMEKSSLSPFSCSPQLALLFEEPCPLASG